MNVSKGSAQLSIGNSHFNDVNLFLTVGTVSEENNHLHPTTQPVHIEHCQLSLAFVKILLSNTHDSFMAVKVTNSVLQDSIVYKEKEGGFFTSLFKNCIFLNTHRINANQGIIIMDGVLLIVRNCYFDLFETVSVYGSAIFMAGKKISKNMQKSLDLANGLACPVVHCTFTHAKLLMEDIMMEGSIFTAAAAVYSENVNFILKNCTFNMTFLSIKAGNIHYTVTDYSLSVIWQHIIFDLSSERRPSSILYVTSQNINFDNVTLLCSKDMKPIELMSVPTFHYSCDHSCSVGHYTQDKGELVLNGPSQKFGSLLPPTKIVNNCFSCPIEADYQNSIVALPNYWGHKHTETNNITMIRCLKNYCCSGNETCKSISSCNTDRNGILCGKCDNNLTESLFSARCVPQESCYTNIIIILYSGSVVLYGTIMLIFHYLKNNILHIWKTIWTFVKGKLFCSDKCTKRKAQRQANTKIELELSEDDDQQNTPKEDNAHKFQDTFHKEGSGMKYLRILFYYVQDAVLFNVQLPRYESSKRESFIIKILQFSLEALAVYRDFSYVCFTYGATAVSKTLLKSIFGLCVMFFLLTLYTILKWSSKCIIPCLSFYNSMNRTLIQTFLFVFLISYQQIIRGAFTLIQCVEINEYKFLYVLADIQCFTWWQIVIKIFLVFYILPLLFVLSHLPFHLKDRKITNQHFILSCIFPTPLLTHNLVLRYYKGRSRKCVELESNTTETKKVKKLETNIVKDVILYTLLEHYRCLTILNLRFTWFGVHKLYRLLLIFWNLFQSCQL